MMDNFNVADKLQFSTIRLTCLGDNFHEEGTGFFFAFPAPKENFIIPVIVTCRHLLIRDDESAYAHSLVGHISMLHDDNEHIEEGTDSPIIFTPEMGINLQNIYLPHEECDLAVLPVGEILQFWLGTANIEFLTPDIIPNNLQMRLINAMHDIVMVGYPQGWRDKVHNLPLFRRGITSTNPGIDFNGEPKFLVDISCLPGSSGSPIFSYELHPEARTLMGPVFRPHVELIGIQSQAYRYDAEGNASIDTKDDASNNNQESTEGPPSIQLPTTTKVFANIGEAVSASRIMDFRDCLLKAAAEHPIICMLSPEYYREFCAREDNAQ